MTAPLAASASCSQCSGARDPLLAGLVCAACLLRAALDQSSGDGGGAADDLLAPGYRLGPYELAAPIGRGGMGVVYRALDTRLGRYVALKTLPRPVAFDADARRAFEQEARILAGLNHPHICAVHDVGTDHGIDFIVMEYVPGQTLAQRLEQGPLPADQTVQYAVQIADALAQAHGLGVTHRDLKPANIMLTDSGAKLLDFGLATGRHDAETEQERTVGTPQYMSPGQLTGRRADSRSDLFAFGLILQQMAGGSNRSGAFEDIVARCVKTDPAQRWQSAEEVLVQLRSIAHRVSGAPLEPATSFGRYRRWVAAAAIAALMSVAAMGDRWAPTHAALSPRVLRFTVPPPPPQDGVGAARGLAFISPDGTRLVWLTSDTHSRTSLAVQPLDSTDPIRLAGTSDARFPFWSPDSRQIAFFAHGQLKKVSADGGSVDTLVDAPLGQGGTWIDQSTIVFSPGALAPLHRVSATGGAAAPLTTLDMAPGEVAHQWPVSLRDGRSVVYFAMTADPSKRALWIVDLKSGARARLCSADTGAAYAPGGHLLFGRGSSLLAATLDVGRMRMVGEPTVVDTHAFWSGKFGPPYFSVSTTGAIVYHHRQFPRSQLMWFDRTGRRLEDVTAVDVYRDLRLSPDASRIAVERVDQEDGSSKVWLLDLERGRSAPLVRDVSRTAQAVWSPDGRRVAFTATDLTVTTLYEMPARGGDKTLLFQSTDSLLLSDWSKDGRFLLYAQNAPSTQDDLWVLPVTPKGEPLLYLRTPSIERQGQFSPDGRWIAYSSDESGVFDVYARRFPDTGQCWRVSTGGGGQPVWRADGQELFYLSEQHQLMSAAIVSAADALIVQPPRPLFELPRGEALDNRSGYAATPDGQRFLFNVQANEPMAARIVANVLLNWLKL